MTTLCATDFHARSQTIRWMTEGDGEIHSAFLNHETDDVRAFYASLPGPVIVGLEAHGYTGWFEQMLSELGITVRIGDAARIRACKTRKQKNDDRDADLMLELMTSERFPEIYRPMPESRTVLQQLRFRHNLVRTRTRIANSLVAIALSCGAIRRFSVLTAAGRRRMSALKMSEQMAWQRDRWFELLDGLDLVIKEVERNLEAEAEKDPRVCRVQTQKGVGLLTGLALVHVLGPPDRFATSRKVAAYVGLDPVESSSGERRHIGRISKQGSRLLRFLLVEGAQTAARHDPELKAVYERLRRKKTHATAKVAIARRVLVRSWILLRDQIDIDEFRRRGRARCGVTPGQPDKTHGLSMPVL